MIAAYEYFENNINFRIESSKILAEYKNMQEFNLREMVHGKYPFPTGTREIFLLKLDIWFRFAMQLEEQMIKLETNRLTSADIGLIIATAKTATAKYTTTMEDPQYNKHFNSSVYLVWKEVHHWLYKYLLNSIDSTLGMVPLDAFKYIMHRLIEILQTTLYELFEIISLEHVDKGKDQHAVCDRLVEEKIAYLCYSDMCPLYYEIDGKHILLERLKVYSKYYNIDKMAIRDYSTDGLSKSCVANIMKLMNDENIELDIESTLGKKK